ncbi:MAG: hypothetical protein ACI841_000340 [Planctomycetota bacterium]|jgi:hypothetical protein
MQSEARTPRRSDSALALLGLALLVAFGTWVRTSVATRDAGFDLEQPTALFKSDPGLLYYLTQRVDQAGGHMPADFAADERIAHPELTDVPATYTIGQEFLVAWAHRYLAPDAPLQAVCYWTSAITASFVVVGIFLLGFALTRSLRYGLAAALLFALSPAAYRTIGFLCIREDLSLPLYALHLGCTAMLCRGGSWRWALAAGFAGAAAWSTWLASGIVLSAEFAVLALVCLCRRESFSRRDALAVAMPLLVASLLVPALAARSSWLSVTTIIAAALILSNESKAKGKLFECLSFAMVIAAGAGLRLWFGSDDLSHVSDLMFAKLAHLGSMPATLSFESRMLWQGPFANAGLGQLATGLGVVLPVALIALALGWRRRAKARDSLALTIALGVALLAGWQVARLLALPALVACGVCVWAFARSGDASKDTRKGSGSLAALVLFVQAILFTVWTQSFQNHWYRPLVRQQELSALTLAIPQHVPEGDAVLADFMNSSAILAHTGRPAILQAKWETREARERVQAFWRLFYHEDPDALHEWCTEEFQCRWLLVDRFTLGVLHASRALAGLGPRDPWRTGSSAEVMLSRDEDVLSGVPGFELVWRSPGSIRQSNGQSSDFYRLYKLVD